jgi:hypothetical protein
MMSRAEVPTIHEPDALARQIADRIRQRHWEGPVALMLRAGQPLALIVGQLLLLGQPALSLVWPYRSIGRLAELLENRRAYQALVELLETG